MRSGTGRISRPVNRRRSKDDFSDKMVEYLGEARKHRETLIQFIKHILR